VKILLLARSLGVGGTERQVVMLAKGLATAGYDVAVAVFYGKGVLERDLVDSGVAVFDLGKRGRWDAASFLIHTIRLIRRIRPTVVYGFLRTPNVLAISLRAFVPRARVVWGVRASYVDWSKYDWLSGFADNLECRLSRFADRVICNSHAGLEYAAARGFPREKMTVVSNGIDTEHFQPQADGRLRVRKAWDVTANQILIGLVARLDPIKDHQTFLQAAARLSGHTTRVRFVCVGDGSEAYGATIKREAENLGLKDRLIWAGERQDMPDIYSALDIGCSSSFGEGFSNTIAEAMACGVPCVVTDVGDSARIVSNLGEVVAPRSDTALYEGFCRILVRIGPELSIAARQSIVDRFSNHACVMQTMQILSRLN
jgi:glycosyltransferase involved in cell wall biosynthesis